ncbi:MAG TPA: zinc metalloprotease HtpX [Actinomycetaceae bacterium]|nr:zinc metalloprotease HtpX [Actinomycetaceae bacterium]
MKDSNMNGLKTVALLGGLWALLLAVGYMLAAGTGDSLWLWLFAGMGLVSTFVSYWFSDKMALAAMRARPLSEAEAPEIHQMVRELAEVAGQPMPSIHISPTESPNAFATGRNPQKAAVCVTSGIVRILDRRELRAVLGHELSHVYNRDILISSVAAAIGGIITSIAQFALFFGGGRNREGGNPFAGILMALLAPLAAAVIRMAISRTREFDADRAGAELTQDPMALASALQKITRGTDMRPMEQTPSRENVSALMISNPFRGGGFAKLFSTHPPTEERVRRLEQIAGYEPRQ